VAVAVGWWGIHHLTSLGLLAAEKLGDLFLQDGLD
jgi:hypothetical protein